MALEDPEQLKLLKKAKRPKYGNQKVELDGHVFDSKAEAAHYIYLRKFCGKCGDCVTMFVVKPPPIVFRSGIKYYPDFYVATWRYTPVSAMTPHGSAKKIASHYIDVKGTETRTFLMKMKMLKNEYPKIFAKLEKPRWNAAQADAMIKGYEAEPK